MVDKGMKSVQVRGELVARALYEIHKQIQEGTVVELRFPEYRPIIVPGKKKRMLSIIVIKPETHATITLDKHPAEGTNETKENNI